MESEDDIHKWGLHSVKEHVPNYKLFPGAYIERNQTEAQVCGLSL